MTMEALLPYYDFLLHLATAKCDSRADAEDLVSETMLAALACLRRGETIRHPKTWLANTLLHKYNDALRQKYRLPTVVCLADCADAADDDPDADATQEAARVREEINRLAALTRETVVRYYYGGQRVAEIAEALGVPPGTVKSRLFAGRQQIRKGLEQMEAKQNLPGRLYLSNGGEDGCNGEPQSLVDNDLIAQNLLILAYEKPLTVHALSLAIGIPAAYLEPILEKLRDGELLAQTDGGRFYTDFLITRPQDALAHFDAVRDFAHRQFDTVWGILTETLERVKALPFARALDAFQATVLERYVALKALQDFEHFGAGTAGLPQFPARKDGGRWLAQAVAVPAGYDTKAYRDAQQYSIQGGHRTTQATAVGRTKRAWLYEFDTTLCDDPHRFGESWGDFELYSRYILPLLLSIYDGLPPEESGVPNDFLARIPALGKAGLLGREGGALSLKIPVLSSEDYRELTRHIAQATDALTAAIGGAWAAFLALRKIPIPKHLTSVPALYRTAPVSAYFPLSILREAQAKSLHLQAITTPCPPVLLVREI